MSAPVKNIKRVLKDYAQLVKEGPENGIFVKTLGDDVSLIYMMIMGPVDSPYEGCPMFFTIEPGTQYSSPFASGGTGSVSYDRQYPVEPPRVLFRSPYSIRCHPNLYQPHHIDTAGTSTGGAGKVCLSILGTWPGEHWVALMTFMTIAQTILGILDNQPLCNEPAFAGKPKDPRVQSYTNIVQYLCIKEATNALLVPAASAAVGGTGGMGGIKHHVAVHFQEEMRQWVLQYRERYIKRLRNLSEHYDGGKTDACPVYGIAGGVKYDFASIAKKFEEL